MQVFLNNQHPRHRISRRYLEKNVRRILRKLGLHQATLSCTFTTNRKIARLNKIYRNKTGPTDVLSFTMSPPELLGDIIISLDKVKTQAKEKGHTLREECLCLIIHGLLHILGYDHHTDAEEKIMQAKEKELLNLFSS